MHHEPVGVERRAVVVRAVDIGEHDIANLTGLVQQLGNLFNGDRLSSAVFFLQRAAPPGQEPQSEGPLMPSVAGSPPTNAIETRCGRGALGSFFRKTRCHTATYRSRYSHSREGVRGRRARPHAVLRCVAQASSCRMAAHGSPSNQTRLQLPNTGPREAVVDVRPVARRESAQNRKDHRDERNGSHRCTQLRASPSAKVCATRTPSKERLAIGLPSRSTKSAA